VVFWALARGGRRVKRCPHFVGEDRPRDGEIVPAWCAGVGGILFMRAEDRREWESPHAGRIGEFLVEDRVDDRPGGSGPEARSVVGECAPASPNAWFLGVFCRRKSLHGLGLLARRGGYRGRRGVVHTEWEAVSVESRELRGGGVFRFVEVWLWFVQGVVGLMARECCQSDYIHSHTT
jgi:hypothetical protein